MSGPHVVDLAGARAALPAALRDTPCVRSDWLSSLARHDVWLKLETLQPTHSFKVRGAWNALRRVPAGAAGVVTASAGNHGSALAWAASQRGIPLTVFTPRDAPRAKLARISALGAELRAEADGYDDAEARARAFAIARGLPFVSPYNDADVIAGAATIGLEILAQVPQADEVALPLGGGGLASGVALAFAGVASRPRVVAAEPDVSPAFTTAIAAGRIVPIVVGETIADGLAGNLEAGSLTFDLVRQHVDRVVRIPEDRLRWAVATLAREEHLVCEGAAAAAVAAVADGAGPATARCTVIVLSGSNIDERRLCELLAASAQASRA